MGAHAAPQKSEDSSNSASTKANRAVVQPKLEIGAPDDAFEQEADAMAEKVVNGISSGAGGASGGDGGPADQSGSGTPTIQRWKQEPRLQRMESPGIQRMDSMDKPRLQRMDLDTPKLQRMSDEEDKIQRMSDDDEPIQRKEDDETIQRMSDDEEKVQRMHDEEEAPIQRRIESEEDEADGLVQTKLESGAIQRRIESEEDEADGLVQTKLDKEGDGPRNMMQRDADGNTSDNSIQRSADGTMHAGANTSAKINQAKGKGGSMDSSTKSEMESGFGQDFSNVKIHADNEAGKLSKEVGAKAFTTGQDIFFKPENYKPHTQEGKALLAHELTHTVQQRGGQVQKIQRTLDYITTPNGKNAATDLKPAIDDFRAKSIPFDLVLKILEQEPTNIKVQLNTDYNDDTKREFAKGALGYYDNKTGDAIVYTDNFAEVYANNPEYSMPPLIEEFFHAVQHVLYGTGTRSGPEWESEAKIFDFVVGQPFATQDTYAIMVDQSNSVGMFLKDNPEIETESLYEESSQIFDPVSLKVNGMTDYLTVEDPVVKDRYYDYLRYYEFRYATSVMANKAYAGPQDLQMPDAYNFIMSASQYYAANPTSDVKWNSGDQSLVFTNSTETKTMDFVPSVPEEQGMTPTGDETMSNEVPFLTETKFNEIQEAINADDQKLALKLIWDLLVSINPSKYRTDILHDGKVFALSEAPIEYFHDTSYTTQGPKFKEWVDVQLTKRKDENDTTPAKDYLRNVGVADTELDIMVYISSEFFNSVPELFSTVKHEWAHVEQILADPFFFMGGKAVPDEFHEDIPDQDEPRYFNEVKAYLWEVENMRATGMDKDPDALMNVWYQLRDYWRKLKPNMPEDETTRMWTYYVEPAIKLAWETSFRQFHREWSPEMHKISFREGISESDLTRAEDIYMKMERMWEKKDEYEITYDSYERDMTPVYKGRLFNERLVKTEEYVDTLTKGSSIYNLLFYFRGGRDSTKWNITNAYANLDEEVKEQPLVKKQYAETLTYVINKAFDLYTNIDLPDATNRTSVNTMLDIKLTQILGTADDAGIDAGVIDAWQKQLEALKTEYASKTYD